MRSRAFFVKASGLPENEKVQDGVKYLVSLNHMVKMINTENCFCLFCEIKKLIKT